MDERKYEDALKRAKDLLDDMDKGDYFASKADIENIFPELQENKDERIRKTIYGWIYTQPSEFFDNGFSKEEMLAWLEKQREQTHAELGQSEATKTSDQELEPKFHKGEWIIHQGTENIYQVIARIDNQYQLKYGDNYTVQKCADVDRCARLWNITKDAKDGDVLATAAGAFIYNGNNGGGGCPGSYCGINTLGKFQTGFEHHWTSKKVYPATKEQRDLLFQKMKEAGYEWDSEKKELKKIKIKSKNLELKTLNADKVVEWLKNNGWCTVGGPKVKMAQINKFKNDFGL